jgi:predicted HTH transcriptional regulator
MVVKEPKFMQELHKIRVKMAKEWEKMSPEEIRDSLRASSKWLKKQVTSRPERI